MLLPINGGYLSYIDPKLDCRQACPFWKAGSCPYILRAEKYLGQNDENAYVLDLHQLQCDLYILRQSPSVSHYIFKNEQNMLQIRLFGAESDDSIVKFTIRAGGMLGQGERSLSFKQLHYLLRNNDLSSGLFKANKSSDSFNKTLKVIDLIKGEYCHRDVAEILFPLTQVRRDWGKDPSRVLEKKTSAKIKRIQELVHKNYRNYLRKLDS